MFSRRLHVREAKRARPTVRPRQQHERINDEPMPLTYKLVAVILKHDVPGDHSRISSGRSSSQDERSYPQPGIPRGFEERNFSCRHSPSPLYVLPVISHWADPNEQNLWGKLVASRQSR